MILEIPVKGYFEENCYFYIDDETRHGFIIDAGAEAKRLLKIVKDEGFIIEKILLTHGHFDHIGAVEEIRKALKIPVFAYKRCDEYLLNPKMNLSFHCPPEITLSEVKHLEEGEIVSLDKNPSFGLKVIYTPGHTTDSIIYYSSKENIAFVGDTIFKGSIGNYTFAGGNLADLQKSIIEKIFSLPENTTLYSGHSEKTTVGEEKRRYGFY